MPLTDLIIEMDFGEAILDSQGNPILDSQDRPILDSDWVSVNADTLDESIRIRRGMLSGDITDRVADAGTLTLVMNNSAYNSAGLMGYYSLDHANRRVGFGTGTRVRINMKRASSYYKFHGRLTDIQVESGLLNPKRSYLTAVDWMDYAARLPMPRLPIQIGARDDQLLQFILNSLTEQPIETSMSTGGYLYPAALTDVREGETKVIGAFSSIAASGLGRIFLRGGPTSGEVLSYMSIYDQIELSTPVASFSDNMLKANAERKVGSRLKRVTVRVYPMRLDPDLVTLYSLQQSILIPPGGTISFTGSYTDPASARSISAIDVQTPIVDVDYKFSSVDGSGNDMNSNLFMESFDVGNSAASVSFTNLGPQDGYLWFYRIQGYGLYDYDPLDYTAEDSSITDAEGAVIQYSMPYQSSYNVARDFAKMFLYWFSPETTDVPTIEFNAGQSTDAIDWAVDAEPGTLVEVVESVTGIARNYMVIGYDMEIRSKNDIPVVLYVVPTLSGQFLKLDVVGRAELDTNAPLGV